MVPLRPSAHGPHYVARRAHGPYLAKSAAALVLAALILTTTLLGGCALFRPGSPISGGSPGDPPAGQNPGDPSGGTGGQPADPGDGAGDPAGGDTAWIDAGSSPFPVRGVIEGFYGQPWTQEERLRGHPPVPGRRGMPGAGILLDSTTVRYTQTVTNRTWHPIRFVVAPSAESPVNLTLARATASGTPWSVVTTIPVHHRGRLAQSRKRLPRTEAPAAAAEGGARC